MSVASRNRSGVGRRPVDTSIGSRTTQTWSPPASRRRVTRPTNRLSHAAQERHARDPWLPLDAAELVDVVSGLPAEQLGQVVLVSVQEVHRQVVGPPGEPAGAVGRRQPHGVDRGLDAGLRVEPDEAAVPLVLGGDGDDHHGAVHRRDQVAEVTIHRHHQSVGNRGGPARHVEQPCHARRRGGRARAIDRHHPSQSAGGDGSRAHRVHGRLQRRRRGRWGDDRPRGRHHAAPGSRPERRPVHPGGGVG